MPDPSTSNTSTNDFQTLVHGFREQVKRRGDAGALYSWNGEEYAGISWTDFGAAAERVAAFLHSEGIAQHDHVAIWSTNSAEWHMADAGILSARCRTVPIYPTLSDDQVAYVLDHSQDRVIFVEGAAQRDSILNIRDRLPALQRIVMMSGSDSVSHGGLVLSWDEALQRGQTELAIHRDEISARADAVVADDIATLIYTSGTTGPPKAVPLTHRNILAALRPLETFAPMGPDDRVLSYLPLAHVAERSVSEFRSYLYGSSVYFLDSIPKLGERLQIVQPAQFFGVPRIWEKMAQTVKTRINESPKLQRRMAHWAIAVGERVADVRERGDQPSAALRAEHRLAEKVALGKLRTALGFSNAKMLASGAAPISPDVLRFFRSLGLEVCEVYGQTENCGISTVNRPGSSRVGTVGNPVPGIEVRLAPDGEILVKGDNVFAGYYKDPTATAETLVDGWLHTGDVGEFDADGYLRITDRKKDLIITAGGKNIAPSNLETLLKGHDLIANAVAIGDARPFVSALVTLDPEEAKRFAASHGVGGDLAAISESEAVHQVIQAHVDSVNKGLSQVEKIKKWTVLPRDFTMGDELTPTLKVKRKVVAEKYKGVIDGMYTGRARPGPGE